MDWLKSKFQRKISSSAQHELIQVDPNEPRFPFLPNAMLSASSSIKLVNATDNWVVFVTRPRSANVAWYYTRPDGGILPPRSTQEFLVTREAKKSVAQSIECDDKYILFSTVVAESFSNSKYSSDLDKFYDDQGGQIWHRRDLGVVLYPAYQHESPHGIPHTEVSSPYSFMCIVLNLIYISSPFYLHVFILVARQN